MNALGVRETRGKAANLPAERDHLGGPRRPRGEVAVLDPQTELEPIEPGFELPGGGLVALYHGRGRAETPLWLPEQRALVIADALTARAGELRVWSTPWHEERALPTLRKLLELPFERVIVSHGEPVHDRSTFERALELPPWQGDAPP